MSRIRVPPHPSELPSGGCVGVDPGKDGTIGYAWAPGEGEFWRFDQMTDVESWEIIKALKAKARAFIIEKVGPAGPNMRGRQQGIASTAKFMRQTGRCEGWLIAAEVRRGAVAPGVWQRGMECPTKGDKKVSQRKAQELWPQLVFTQDNQEGLLIAEWGRLFSPLMR